MPRPRRGFLFSFTTAPDYLGVFFHRYGFSYCLLVPAHQYCFKHLQFSAAQATESDRYSVIGNG